MVHPAVTVLLLFFFFQIFKESGRPSRPMASFTMVAALLAAAEGVNSCLFFARVYSSQGMLFFER